MRVISAIALCEAHQLAQAATVTFNFDNVAPVFAPGTPVPVTQSVGAITATFSSPAGPAFSVQDANSTTLVLSTFSGSYLYPNTAVRNALDISLNRSLLELTLRFATVDSFDPEIPSNIELTAFLNSVAVGSPLTTHGSFIVGDTYPQGTLGFGLGGQPFNSVRLIVPFQATGATTFLVDSITVITNDVAPAIPEPVSLTLFGTGVAVLAILHRRGRYRA
jgi:hypothetical protein